MQENDDSRQNERERAEQRGTRKPFCSNACLGWGPRPLECDPSQQTKIHAEDKGKSMALDAGEPLLCDRPIGQHAAVPVALSLVVDQRSRTIGLSQTVGILLPSGTCPNA